MQRPRLTGCIAAFDLAGQERGYLCPAGPVLQRRVRERGVFQRPLGDVVYLLPPLGIDDAQLERCWGAIAEALDEALDEVLEAPLDGHRDGDLEGQHDGDRERQRHGRA